MFARLGQAVGFDTNKVKVVRDNQTVQQVLDSITDASDSNRYMVFVPPGHENEFYIGKPFVNVIFQQCISSELLPLQETIIHDCQTEWEGANIDTNSPYGKCNYVTVNAGEDTNVTISGNWDITKYHGLYILLKLEGDESSLKKVVVMFDAKTDGSNFYRTPAQVNEYSIYVMPNRWIIFPIYFSGWYKVNNPDLSNVNNFSFYISNQGTQPITVKWTKLTAYYNIWQSPMVTFLFGAGNTEIWTRMCPLFFRRNLKATVASIITWQDARLEWEKLEFLQNMGWDIISHSMFHLSDVGDIDIHAERETYGTINIGKLKGLDLSRCFCLPHVYMKSYNIIRYAQENFNFTLRVGSETFNPSNGINGYPNCFNSLMTYHNADLDTAKSFVNEAMYNRGWLILRYYGLDSDALTLDDWEFLLDYIEERGIRVVTFSDIAKLFKPPKVLPQEQFRSIITLGDDLYYQIYYGQLLNIDPNGEDRNISPIEEFPISWKTTIVNTGSTGNLIFDPSGLNLTIQPGQSANVIYDGDQWRQI